MTNQLRSITLALAAAAILTGGARADETLRVSPPAVVLDGPDSAQQILVTTGPDGTAPAGARRRDVTREARYSALDPQVAAIDRRGLIEPRGEGRTEIVIERGDAAVRVPVEVKGLRSPPPVSFAEEVIPVLTKARCNSGSCHGKAEGKNGFKLTVFGFDPREDHEAIAGDGRSRRIFPAAPDHSLLLRKASAEVPHGGGLRIDKDSRPYRRLRRWIAEGARFTAGDSLVALAVEPEERILAAGEKQQLRVTAIDSAGRRRCVTVEAEYETDAQLTAAVDERGLLEAGGIPGQAAILVRFREQIAVCRVTVPRTGASFARPPEANFIDRHLWDRLERLGIPPSGLASDPEFLRRAYLDVIGTLPAAGEARRFLLSSDLDKRARLIEDLLARDEYADYWAQRWADLLRVDSEGLGAQAAFAMTRWLRRQFAENRPYDRFARDVLTARGDFRAEGPAALFKVLDSPEAAGRSLSQVFLGVRIECAQCHHHPSEIWGQADFYGLAGFFTGLKKKSLPGGGEALLPAGGSDLAHPRTGQPVPARALGAAPAVLAGVEDRRRALADWMVAPDNPYFARAIANRLWSHYYGRGLVEPADDLRSTNPAASEPPLPELARHLVEVGYDLKAFTRTLLSSRAYQLTSETERSNASDDRNFSHASWRPMPAEVLLDAICQATGVPEKFPGLPEGQRAIEVWDNRLPSYFLRIFGRPARASVCECERSGEPSISQALHFLNSPEILGKVHSPSGRARRLAESSLSAAEIIDELFLWTLSRFPSAEETGLLLASFAAGDRRAAAEDALWALLNTREFLYNH